MHLGCNWERSHIGALAPVTLVIYWPLQGTASKKLAMAIQFYVSKKVRLDQQSDAGISDVEKPIVGGGLMSANELVQTVKKVG